MVELCSNGDGITIQGGAEMDGDGGPPGDRAAGIPLITDRCAALAFLRGVDTSIRQAFQLAYLLPPNANITLCKKMNLTTFHRQTILHYDVTRERTISWHCSVLLTLLQVWLPADPTSHHHLDAHKQDTFKVILSRYQN